MLVENQSLKNDGRVCTQEVRAGGDSLRNWSQVRDDFLSLVSPRQRPLVAELLRQPRRGGQGLRMWLQALVTQARPMPESLPAELIEVYLKDPEAVPLHDCSECGLAIPVHPAWQGYEWKPECVYFPECPCCGAATGLHAYWSNGTRA